MTQRTVEEQRASESNGDNEQTELGFIVFFLSKHRMYSITGRRDKHREEPRKGERKGKRRQKERKRKGSRSNSVQLQKELRRKVKWLGEGGGTVANLPKPGREERRGEVKGPKPDRSEFSRNFVK